MEDSQDIMSLINDSDDKIYDDDFSPVGKSTDFKKPLPPSKIRIKLNGKTFDREIIEKKAVESPPDAPPPSPVRSSREWRRPDSPRPEPRRRGRSRQRRRPREHRPRHRRHRKFQQFWPPHEFFELAKKQLEYISSNPQAFSALCREWDDLHNCGMHTFTNMQGFINTFGPQEARRLFIFSIATNGTLRGIFENYRASPNTGNPHNLFP